MRQLVDLLKQKQGYGMAPVIFHQKYLPSECDAEPVINCMYAVVTTVNGHRNVSKENYFHGIAC